MAQARIYDTFDEAVDREILEYLVNCGEDSNFYDIDTVAEHFIDEDTDDAGNLIFIPTTDDDTTLGKLLLKHMYEVVSYSDGVAYTSSESEEVQRYVAAHNLGNGEKWLKRNGWTVEKLSTNDSEATYERLIAPSDLLRAHLAIAEAKRLRAVLVRSEIECGRSMYSIAQELGLSNPAIAKIAAEQ